MKENQKYDDIKKYWDERAKKNVNTTKITTDDFYMRSIEYDQVKNAIESVHQNVFKIADFGCGDGLTTIKIADNFKEKEIIGLDYSYEMIKIAKKNRERSNFKNVSFECKDIFKDKINHKFDLVYTTRCLINLPFEYMQYEAISKIHEMLNDDGFFIMVENFIDGHNEFNSLRKKFNLEGIPIRDHNLYFNQDMLLDKVKQQFDLLSISNISSLYYIVSRVVYSKICFLENKKPDYLDVHHQLASELPVCGNYGPIKMIIFKKIKGGNNYEF